MLYAVRHPLALLALVVAFVVGLTLRGLVQAWLAARLGDRSAVAAGRGRPDPRRHLDPFGAVSAAVAGVGWGPGLEAARSRRWQRGRYTLAVLSGPLVLALLAALGYLVFVLVGGSMALAGNVELLTVLHGLTGPAGQVIALSFATECAALCLLSLVPLPPLDGGRLLFVYAPRSIGWQKAEYHLADRNIGVVIVLVLLLLPLASQQPLLLALIDVILRAVLGLFG